MSKPRQWHLLVACAALSVIGIAGAQAESPPPVFELDCISFAGRFLANAPIKKKPYAGLAADGTDWSVSPDGKVVSITRIFAGEAAEKAGIEVGDEVLNVNGYPLSGLSLREVFAAYHMYDPSNLSENLVVRKKDGTEKSVKLTLLPVEQCNPEEKAAWLSHYQAWGY